MTVKPLKAKICEDFNRFSLRERISFAAGIDEAGRGPLAGPVVAACVILNPEKPTIEVRDSKKLSAKQRDILYDQIIANALLFGIGHASHQEIDDLNIHHATLLAMQRAFENMANLITNPQHIKNIKVFVDGKFAPILPCPTEAIIGGDDCVPEISAASILAKVTRDREMTELDLKYPHYGFSIHKGYPTTTHIKMLKQLGPCKIHRKSFRPVREIMV